MGSHRTWTGCSRIRWGGFRCTIRQRRRRSFDCVWHQRQTPLRMTDSIYLLLRRFDLPAPAVLSPYCGGSIYLLRRLYLLPSAVLSTYSGAAGGFGAGSAGLAGFLLGGGSGTSLERSVLPRQRDSAICLPAASK